MESNELGAHVKALIERLRLAIAHDEDPSEVMAELAALTERPDVSLDQAMAVLREISTAAADLLGGDAGTLREIAAIAGSSSEVREAVETAGLVQRMLTVANGAQLAAALRPLAGAEGPEHLVRTLRAGLAAADLDVPTSAMLLASLAAAEAELAGRFDPAAWDAVLGHAEAAGELDLVRAAVDRLQPPALAAQDWARVGGLARRVAAVAAAAGATPQELSCHYEEAICLSRLGQHREAAALAHGSLERAEQAGLAALVPRGRLVVARVLEESGDPAALDAYASLRDDLADDPDFSALRARAALGVGRISTDPAVRGPALALARAVGRERRDAELYREASLRLATHHADAGDMPRAVEAAVEGRIRVAVLADADAAAPFMELLGTLEDRFGAEAVRDEALAVVERIRAERERR